VLVRSTIANDRGCRMPTPTSDPARTCTAFVENRVSENALTSSVIPQCTNSLSCVQSAKIATPWGTDGDTTRGRVGPKIPKIPKLLSDKFACDIRPGS
jgi:hypothetical protein